MKAGVGYSFVNFNKKIRRETVVILNLWIKIRQAFIFAAITVPWRAVQMAWASSWHFWLPVFLSSGSWCPCYPGSSHLIDCTYLWGYLVWRAATGDTNWQHRWFRGLVWQVGMHLSEGKFAITNESKLITENLHHNVTLLLSFLWGEFSPKMKQNWSDNLLEKVHVICELRAVLLMAGKRPLGIDHFMPLVRARAKWNRSSVT